MDDQLFSLIYTSKEKDPFDEQGLIDLLAVARKNNEACNVTGMLLYSYGVFIQVLEGPRGKVQKIYDQILEDPRHYTVIILSQSLIDKRQFDSWDMGFISPAREELAKISGFSEFLHDDFDTSSFLSDNPVVAQKLLVSFRDNMT